MKHLSTALLGAFLLFPGLTSAEFDLSGLAQTVQSHEARITALENAPAAPQPAPATQTPVAPSPAPITPQTPPSVPTQVEPPAPAPATVISSDLRCVKLDVGYDELRTDTYSDGHTEVVDEGYSHICRTN